MAVRSPGDLAVGPGSLSITPGKRSLRAIVKSGGPKLQGEWGVIGERRKGGARCSAPCSTAPPRAPAPTITAPISPASPPLPHGQPNFNTEQTITPLGTFRCDHKGCEKIFKNRKTLRQHFGVHIFKSWTCSVCNSKFLQKSHFDAHLKVHTRESTFTCTRPGCSRS